MNIYYNVLLLIILIYSVYVCYTYFKIKNNALKYENKVLKNRLDDMNIYKRDVSNILNVLNNDVKKINNHIYKNERKKPDNFLRQLFSRLENEQDDMDFHDTYCDINENNIESNKDIEEDTFHRLENLHSNVSSNSGKKDISVENFDDLEEYDKKYDKLLI